MKLQAWTGKNGCVLVMIGAGVEGLRRGRAVELGIANGGEQTGLKVL